jgi:uncharacterized glyoxalase superfamily protein PhnB
MTTTEGIEGVFLTTHNWGKAAKFFQALGYELEFVVSTFADTHWGTREMVVRDPDGRMWSLQAPGSTAGDR